MRDRRSPYVVIYLDARKQLKLSLTEYALVEMIDRLSGPRSPKPGWCVASRKYLAESLGITERTVYTMLDHLTEQNLLERSQSQPHLVRTTQAWKESVGRYRPSEAA